MIIYLNIFWSNMETKNKTKIPNLDKFLERNPDIKVEMVMDKYDGYVEIEQIIVPEEKRNSGFGTMIMSMITNYADKNNMKIFLIASDILGSNFDRLVDFYRRFGFKITNISKIVDETAENQMLGNMIREKKYE